MKLLLTVFINLITVVILNAQEQKSKKNGFLKVIGSALKKTAQDQVNKITSLDSSKSIQKPGAKTVDQNTSNKQSGVQTIDWNTGDKQSGVKTVDWNAGNQQSGVQTVDWNTGNKQSEIKTIDWNAGNEQSNIETVNWGIEAQNTAVKTVNWNNEGLQGNAKMVDWNFINSQRGIKVVDMNYKTNDIAYFADLNLMRIVETEIYDKSYKQIAEPFAWYVLDKTSSFMLKAKIFPFYGPSQSILYFVKRTYKGITTFKKIQPFLKGEKHLLDVFIKN